jgi:CRP/FNR family cyclic AMP-dependent transcriptional regulator
VALDAAVLSQVPLLAGLTPDAVADLAAAGFVRRYRKGMLLFTAGEPGEAIFFVLEGRIRLFLATSDGHEHTLQLVPAGGVLAVVGVLEGRPYPASAETVEDSELALIRTADFARLVRCHADLAWSLLVELSHRLVWAQERIYDFALRSAAGRVASALLRLARQSGAPQDDGRCVLPAPLTHRELAQLAGISRETATRVLQFMRRDGSVDACGEGRVVLDLRRLVGWLKAEGVTPGG